MKRTAILSVCLLSLAACTQEDPRPASRASPGSPGRVLIVGIDGASPRVVEPLMDAGRLPHLKALADDGTYGPIRSLQPILSPRIWTTVATGLLPERHGIRSWSRNAGGEARLFNGHDRRVHALWDLVSDAGWSVATINWLMTYPAGPVNGVVLSDMLLPGAARERLDLWTRNDVPEEERAERARLIEDLGRTTYPDSWREIATGILAEGLPRVRVADPFVGNEHLPKKAKSLSRIAYERDGLLVRLALAVDERERPDVTMLLLQGIDRASHWLWGGFEPQEIYREDHRLDEERAAGYREMLEAYYEYTDELLGLLLELYDEDDLVIVLSDHGFEGGNAGYLRTTGVHRSERALDGVVFVRGRDVRAGHRLKKNTMRVQDITPTTLAWLGIPLAKDLDGKKAGFLKLERSVSNVRTYETKPVPRVPFVRTKIEDDVLEELRQLGYVR